MKRRILLGVLIIAAIGFVACPNGNGEPNVLLAGIRITGIPVGQEEAPAYILVSILRPAMEGYDIEGAAGDIEGFAIAPAIQADGTVQTVLYTGLVVHLMWVHEMLKPPFLEPAFPTTATMSLHGTGNVYASFATARDEFPPPVTMVWRDIRFETDIVDGILEIAWADGVLQED
ncbi:MAG: hypothetical protein FWD88_03905 [Treponema sp.]|nr:hypothetical protein [Treponema sp.]